MTLATGSTQGLVSGANGDKLTGLPSEGQLQELLEVAFPLFIGTPTNGVQSIYTHLLDPQWEFTVGYGAVSAGSTNLTVTINGTPVNGWNNIPITSTGTPFPTSLDATATLAAGSTLGLTLTSTTGNCANMRFSMKASSVLV
jgi:hypothetical protein